MIKTAVVILNWNGAEMLRTFLPSVIRYSDSPGTEIFVADNGSTDNSVELIRTEFPDIHLIVLDSNYGFAEGYNRALAQIDSEDVVLLYSDVEVTKNWLQPWVEPLDAYPETVAFQPKILSGYQKDQFEYA